MIRYIQAEVGRLAKKKSNYIFYVAMMALFTLVTFFVSGDDRTPGTFYMMILNLLPMITIIICIQTFITVYADDVSGHVLATSLSSGVSKVNLVISKIIVSVIYNIAVFIVLGVFLLVHMFLFGGSFDEQGTQFLTVMVKEVLLMLLAMGTFNAIGGVILYLSQKATIGITALSMIALGLFSQILGLLSFVFPPLSKVLEWVPDMLYGGLVNQVMGGDVEIAKMVALAAWLVIGAVASIAVLRKKELEI